MGKPRKVKPEKFDLVPEHRLVMRFAELRRQTADKSSRSVEVVIATENPVERYDEQRGVVLREVLEMDGMVLRGGRNQLPIVDSHDRSSVANVLGSVRDIHVEGDELVGRAYFAADEASQTAFQKLLDGHLTDFSITASPKQIGFVERGKVYKTSRGEVIDGPAEIVKQWMPTDASLVATGADERSVVRRSYTDIPHEVRRMDDAALSLLQKHGMPAEITDPVAAIAWVVGYMTEMGGMPPADDPIEAMEEEKLETEEVAKMDEVVTDEELQNAEREDGTMDEEKRAEEARKAERARQKEIRAICRKAGLEQSFADRLCDSDITLERARAQVLDQLCRDNESVGTTVDLGNVGVRVRESSHDKFFEAAKGGLLVRAYSGAGIQRKPDPTPGAEDFQHIGLRRMAEQFVQRMGGNINRMAPKDIALVAMGHPGAMARHSISRDAYHTTGSFANLMLDAANKTLLAAYEEAEFTWNIWARQAPSAPDFKTLNRIRFSEAPDLQHVPENMDYKEGEMSDEKEAYSVEKFGRIFTVTWETIVNDDLDAISRIPAMQGNAARRTQNKKVYQVLTDNANMADGTALFAAGHSNNATSTGAPSVTTLNAGFTAMRTQTGLGGEIINVMPRYLIVPAALEATALELFTSTGRPDVGGSAVGHSGVQNIYGPGGRRSVEIVAEPQLDGNSTTAWYLAADNRSVDTVELCFLQGEESPVLENEWDFDKDCYKYKIRQTFGVKAIDWRGLYRNTG